MRFIRSLHVAQGEMDPAAVNVDCSGSIAGDALAGFYAPAAVEIPPSSFGVTQLEAKIRGALLMPYSLTIPFRAHFRNPMLSRILLVAG